MAILNTVTVLFRRGRTLDLDQEYIIIIARTAPPPTHGTHDYYYAFLLEVKSLTIEVKKMAIFHSLFDTSMNYNRAVLKESLSS